MSKQAKQTRTDGYFTKGELTPLFRESKITVDGVTKQVRFRPVTTAEGIALSKKKGDGGDGKSFEDMTIHIVSRCIVDENGDPMFTPEEVHNMPVDVSAALSEVLTESISKRSEKKA